MKSVGKRWKAKADRLRLNIGGTNGDGWLKNVRTLEDYKLLEEAYKAGAVDPWIYRQVTEKMAALLYEEKYRGQQYEDHFGGQTQANYVYGKMGLDSAFAWNRYLNDPTEDNLRYAQTVDRMMAQFEQNNAATLADDATLPWISQSLAGYVPQLWEQTKAMAVGGTAGASIGFLVGNPISGAKIGATVGRGKLSYDMARGAAFRTLLEMGVDEESAKAAANDEAVLSSIVEMGDAAIDIFTLGSGAGLKAAGKSVGKQLGKALGKYGINIGTEALEEGVQSFISTANQNRALDGTAGNGTLNLLGESAVLGWNVLAGKDAEAGDAAFAAAKEGAKIAAMLGGTNLVGRYGGSAIQNGIQNQNMVQQTVQPGERIAMSPVKLQRDVIESVLPQGTALAINGHMDPALQEKVDAMVEAYQDYLFLDGFNEDLQNKEGVNFTERARDISDSKAIRVGKVSILKNPYTGKVPTYIEYVEQPRIKVSNESLQTARQQITNAKTDSQLFDKSYKSLLTKIREKIFMLNGGYHEVAVNGLEMNGAPYIVSVHKSMIAKVISDKNMTPHKLAVLDVLDEVIRNGMYVGSNRYEPKGNKIKDTIRFDIFETPIRIDGVDYIVSFDVEVFPSQNNYRTHKVINEMNLIPVHLTDTGTDLPQGFEE